MKHLVTFGILAASLIFTAGCNNGQVEDDPTMPNVPYAEDDAMAYQDVSGLGPGENFGGSSDWNSGASEKSLGEGTVDADGWRLADPTGNRLNMPIIYFAYDSDVLIDSQKQNLDKIAEYLADKPELGLVLEGHCDQRGTEEYNRALGERRANAIRAYLAGRGLADSRMKTVSYGEDKPAVSGDNESAWKQNRRGVPVPMIMPQQ